MKFVFESNHDKSNLIEIFENFQLLLKISPPQINYKIIDDSKGLVEQTLFVKSIKKEIKFESINKKNSENEFLIKIVSGPLKNTETKITILDNNSGSKIIVEIKLKIGLSYKLFSSILQKKLKSINLTLFNRLEKFGELVFNKKYKIGFEEDYEILTIQLENKKLFFKGWWLGDIFSSFIENTYEKLPLKNKTIIDVGANIGDTSIAFIQNGAKKVIGLEPFPKNFEFFKMNVLRNNLNEEIQMLQAGCSSESSEIFVDPKLSGLSFKMENKENGEKIHQFSLDKLIEKFSIVDGIIKMNCEGCEYDTILNTPKYILKKFSHILIQYHDGYNKLTKKLEESGFDVNVESYSDLKGQIFAKNIS